MCMQGNFRFRTFKLSHLHPTCLNLNFYTSVLQPHHGTMEDEFNSSDIEYVPPAKPFPNLGARSIQKLRDNAEADRVESKRNSKELTICSGTLATRKHFALWSNRYEAFVTDTLEKDLANSKPKGEDIERFFFAITKYLQPQGNAQTAIPYSTLEGALVVVLKAIRLHHEDFRLTHRENYRIKDVFQTLVDKGWSLIHYHPHSKPHYDRMLIVTQALLHANLLDNANGCHLNSSLA